MHLSNVGQDDILAKSSSSVSPQEIKTPQERLSIDITEDTSIRYISWKKTLKKVLALAVPYSINGYIITLGIFVNTLIFANFGEDELAASAITSAAGLFTVAVAKASFGSTSELTSRNINTKEMLGVIQQQSWIQAIIESIPLIIITSFNKPIFIALGQQPKIVEIANRYLLYYNVAIPPILLLKSTEKFLISIKHAHTALFFNLFNTLSSCGFGYLLALGKMGFPKLGITGIAHASSISAWLSFSLTVIYLFSRKQFLEYRIFSSSLFGRMEITKQLFKIGIPLAMQTGAFHFYR